jgi:Phosphatidylglycerol lysyltransferase, C-terminal
MEPSWLDRPALKRAQEWGKNLEALSVPGFRMSILAISLDLAWGATEEVRDDCILIRIDDRIKILPLVSDWQHYDYILEREAKAFGPEYRLGCVPEVREHGWAKDLRIVKAQREFVYHRESVSELLGKPLQTNRKDVRSLKRRGVAIEPIGEHNLLSVLECNERWYLKNQDNRTTFSRSRTIWAFKNASLLERIGVKQIAAVLDGEVVGYQIAGPLGASWAALTYGRGDTEPAGVASYLVSEAAKLFPDCTWLNAGRSPYPSLAAFKERFTINASDQQVAMGWVRTRS